MTTSSEQTEYDYSPQTGLGGGICTPSYASILSESEHQELLEKVRYIPEHMDASKTELVVPSYQVDHAIREACLADPGRWREEEGTLVFTSSNRLKVYIGTPANPLSADQARTRISRLSLHTVITARIVLGLWNTRKSNKLLLAENEDVVMRPKEVFEWRGLKKRSYDGSHSRTYRTMGYRVSDNAEVLKDLDLLASCCIRGLITYTREGKHMQETINSPYLHYSLITRNTPQAKYAADGVSVGIGDWFSIYAKHGNYFAIKISRNVFQLNPHDHQHELKLALFLLERWRQQSQKKNPNEPIIMTHLLALSMIKVDYHNLTSRFVWRIQEALQVLLTQDIIGNSAECISFIDTSLPRWGNTWLASQWIIPPSSEQNNTITSKARQPSKKLRGKSSIKAIETLYGGRRYRSRVEAKWNIFLEALGIDNRYEEEGYTFDGMCYLPDFWLPNHQCWIEIKGEEPSADELEKACLLSLYKEKPVYIFFGEAWLPNQQKHEGAYRCCNGKTEKGYFWYECLTCKTIGLGSSQNSGRFSCQCSLAHSPTNSYSNNSNRLLEAYTLARQARFEYGEQKHKNVEGA